MSTKYYPPAGFHFKVFIESFPQEGIDNAFREVSGIAMNLETKPLVEGGVNFMARKLPVRTSYEDLELKRGLVSMGSKLSKWCFSTFGNKSTGQIEPKLVTLQLTNDKSKPIMTWTFHDAYPIKWNVSGFHAQESAIVVESMTLSYTFFEVNGDDYVEEGDDVGGFFDLFD